VSRGVSEEVRSYVLEQSIWERDPGRLEMDTPLLDGSLDSFGLQMLIAFLENRYKIVIENEELVPDNFSSIAAVSRLVETKLGSSAS
jgi:acyl carrier protein